ncbi:MAG: glycosyltransferase family A protein [Candidatus Bathyarchaeia archaeon]
MTDEGVDVVMLTKDSEYLLEKCLKSIYENVPVKRLIVIDGFSKDKTLEILENFKKKYGNIEIISDDGTRAKARERGIKEVNTEWFMFVDSDVILCKDWFKRAKKYMADDVGAIWGLNVDVIPTVRNELFLKSLALVARQCFNLRGGMHDTLIRHETVKDIKIPEQLHAYEDAYIVNWIKKKNWKVIAGDDLYCLHHRPQSDWTLKESLSLATLEIKCGLIYSRIFAYAFYYPFFVVYWALQFISKNLLT